MNQHDANQHTHAVHDVAHAWRLHAQRDGVSDPETELVARQAVHGSPRAGYRPSFHVPATGDLVVIFTNEPHRTQQDAIGWLQWMLEQLHNNGNICLYSEVEAA